MRYLLLFLLLIIPLNSFALSEKDKAYFEEFTNRRKMPKNFYNQALVLQEKGDLRKAAELYKNSLKLSTDIVFNDEVCQHLADIYMKLNRPKESLKFIRRIQSSQLRLLMEGNYSMYQCDYVQAMNSFARYLVNFSSEDSCGVRLNFAEALFQGGRIKDALSVYLAILSNKSAVTCSDVLDKAAYGAAWCYLKQDDKVNAIIYFKNTAGLSPDTVIKDEAIKQVEKLESSKQATDLDSMQNYFESAIALEEAGKKEDAAIKYCYITDNCRDKPLLVKAFFRLAKIYSSQADYDNTKKVYEQIISLGVPEAKIAREKLNELKFR